ncbi:MAG: hypothetical protein MJ159_00245 [Treponemataceae bacterium]|nr:hypothetical protein [Treponemataceae bacterium]
MKNWCTVISAPVFLKPIDIKSRKPENIGNGDIFDVIFYLEEEGKALKEFSASK